MRPERRVERHDHRVESREIDELTCAATQSIVVGDEGRPSGLDGGGGRRDAVRRQYGVPVAGPDRDSEPHIAYNTGSVARHNDRGPVAPKSVIDSTTRWGCWAANSSTDVPNVGTSRRNRRRRRCRPARRGRGRLRSRPRRTGPAPRCACWRCARQTGCSPRPASAEHRARGFRSGFDLEHVGAQVGEQARHRVAVAARQVEDAHGVEQPVGHQHTVPAGAGPGRADYCATRQKPTGQADWVGARAVDYRHRPIGAAVSAKTIRRRHPR